MADFIDFVVDCTKDGKLGKEFISVADEVDGEKLSAWFKEKGYSVKLEDAARLTKKGSSEAIKETVKSGSY